MAGKKRTSDTPLRQRLFQEFYRFDFFKAVGLLERITPQKRRIGQSLSPADEPVRFHVKPGFQFPASDIAELKPERAETFDPPAHMAVTFLGLTGPNRALPDWYTQMALEQQRRKDNTQSAFYDLFHHRLISLFYLAWRKYRFPENYEQGARDRLSGYLLSLIGLGTPGLTGRIGLPEESLTFYTGLLAMPMASAISIEATVAFLAGTRVRVDQFINRLVPIGEEDRTQVGAANSRLGEDAICGSHTWENESKFRVNLGPMSYADFQRFLPSGDLLAPTFALVRYMVGVAYEFEIRVHLRREEVPICALGGDPDQAVHLGWTTWSRHADFRHAENPYVDFIKPD